MIESLRRRAGRFGLDIILISVWEGSNVTEEAGRYRDIWGIEGTILIDETAAYARALGVRGVPTNVFVDESGVVRQVGATTFEELLDGAIRLVPELASEVDDLLAASRIPLGFGGADGR